MIWLVLLAIYLLVGYGYIDQMLKNAPKAPHWSVKLAAQFAFTLLWFLFAVIKLGRLFYRL